MSSRFIARLFPFKKPAILLLSYPRSGSSWIGKVLSTSPDIAYLREPVNQAYLNKFNEGAIIDPYRDETTLKWYTQFADQAFMGIPPENVAYLIENTGDLSLLRRRRTNILIKEVNPLAASLYVQRYSPKVVYIVRHPAAVAASFAKMGWISVSFEDFGYMYGAHTAQAIDAVEDGWYVVIEYEDFAHDPLRQFKALFSSIGIQPPDDFDKTISEYSEREFSSEDPYDIRRSSRYEEDKWKKILSQTQIDDVLR
ncbi:MAG: sulfotransferase domain-containing protein, partial [Chloroflexota bacterium]|nr:sulfotransferase domain-containing protein [Chloroflexota bacterium]